MARKRDANPGDGGTGCPASVHLGRALEDCAPGLKPQIIEKLAAIGIKDAEEFLAVSAVEEVREHLVAYLAVSKQEFEAAVREARQAVPESIALEVTTPD